jgi:branched-chain amino acid transport system ATP-binding protein
MLELVDLHAAYGNIRALHGVSLQVSTGEAVAVIGSNGAGKSTMLRTISGLMRARSGTITYDGIDVTRASTDRIVSLGISHCPEGRRIFGRLSVYENLVLGGVLRPASDVVADIRRIGELFPRLAERLDQPGGTLSGGEQQMLAVARALMAKPRLLILDEPSLGLAPMLVQHIFEVIEQLKAEGLTILLVEQNVHHALDLADRAYIMESGRITLEGTGADLRHDARVESAYLGFRT